MIVSLTYNYELQKKEKDEWVNIAISDSKQLLETVKDKDMRIIETGKEYL